MSKKNRRWLIICIILFLPWLIRAPRNLQKNIDKLELPLTWQMTPTERKIHFLKAQMEELGDDYFAMLLAADRYREGRRISFRVNMPENLTEAEKIDMMLYRGFAPKYASYWLSPCRPPAPGKQADLELYYRCEPPKDNGRIVEIIPSTPSSYLVETAP
ncbi:MAG: hypothetical protein JXA52_03065 [Planctomycetes bacterium]|nr:hypothetical protein [Planctomycetota bacterium]